jgi:hypothetical protein
MQTLGQHPDILRPPSAPGINPVAASFVLMMLMSTYDKSGVAIGLGGHSVSITVYKLVFVALALWVAAEFLLRPVLTRERIDRRLMKLIVAFVFVQTMASLVGSLLTSGSVPLTAEIYYFIQRAHLLFIPLIALRLRLSHRLVLAFFMGAVLIHYAFIALQFVSPGTYDAFSQSIADPLRRDNSLGWTGGSLDFVGLQTTSNYGAFAAALGLLALALRPRNRLKRCVIRAMGGCAVVIAVLSPSRATFLMTMVALLVYWMKARAFSKLQVSLGVVAIIAVIASGALFNQVKLPQVGAIHAFVDPERSTAGGSTFGKLLILENSIEIVARSPVFGWGQRRFDDLAAAQGIEGLSEFTHFYFLSVLLSSGVVGFLAYMAVTIAIARALWRRKERDYAAMCAVFIGFSLYGFLYDAGHLDVFACFSGVAAYWALRSVTQVTPSFRA